MMKNKKLIIFDLDGTLLDTSKGIFNSVRYAEEKMGIMPTLEKNLKLFLGPPPVEMYQHVYGMDKKQGLEATKWHREYGSKHAIYEAELYPGVKETLEKLCNKGYHLAVATLKRQDIAEKILSLQGIDKFFVQIAGMNMSESDTKADLILRVCRAEGIELGDLVLMVGDSQYDYEGAKEAGVDFLGVSYGYGFEGTEVGIRFVGNFVDIKTVLLS